MRDRDIKLEILVIFIAVGIGINSQFSAFHSKYVMNNDVRAFQYWMGQFRDPELFKDDLLTEYSKSFLPRKLQRV